MFDQKLKEIINTIYSGRVIIFSNYKIRETLFSKGISPAIFLNQYYDKSSGGQLSIEYNIKERGMKQMGDIVPIDIQEYDWFRQQKLKTILKERVQSNYKLRPSKDITKEDLINKDLSENFLRSLNFNWFEDASRLFLYYTSLDEENHKLSTLQQPHGLTYLIELDGNTNIRSEYEKIKKQSDLRLKKMFTLNPQRVRNIPVSIFILFSTESKITQQQAQKQYQSLKYEYKFQNSMICLVQINTSDSVDMIHWSNYSRPILNIQYKLQPSDPIRIFNQNQQMTIKTFVNNQKYKIRQIMQNRIRQLCRRYQQANTTKNKFLSFFKGSAVVQKSYSAQQAETRQIADYLFFLGDYKRAIDLYKSLAQKFQSNQRDQTIFYNICQMIQLAKCLNIFSPNHVNINRLKIYESIEKYAQKFMIKRASNFGKLKLNRYLIFLLYFFHCFKVFNKQFIKNNFYYFIKKSVNQQTVTPNYQNPLIIPTLLHEQFANLNLLYPNSEFRRYCYDLVRVASKFSEYKLHYHHLRCILISNKIYQGTFPLIQRYINTSLCKTYFEMKKHRQTISAYKNTWNLLLKNYQESGSNQQQSQFTKFESNYKKIVYQVQKTNSSQLERETQECISMPKVANIVIQIADQSIESNENLGSSWQSVGDILLEKPQLVSKGMSKQNMMKMLKMFDAVTPQEKQLAYRLTNPQLTQAFIKRNSRQCFINQPILFTFDMKNTLKNMIEFDNVKLHFKNPKKCEIKLKGDKSKFQIPPQHSVSLTFQVIPFEAGLYEFSHLSWSFSKITSIYRLKQPYQYKTSLKSFYYKINVLQQAGIINVQINHSSKHFEGQLAEVQLIFTNHGRQQIQEIHLATEHENIFGFKLKKFDFSLLPGQTKIQQLKIKIPLFESNKNHSNFWKCINKSIFLYKTNASFRVFRTVTVFHIHRIAQIYNIVCERVSRNLHFLSFSIRYDNNDQQKPTYLKSLVIDGGLQIKKQEKNQFGSSIIQYFFFLRRNHHKDLQEYKFTIHGMSCDQLIRRNYELQAIKVQNDNKALLNSVKLYFLWSDKSNNIGIIDPKPIPITTTQNKDQMIKLPFNVKIMVEDEIQFNFQKNSFLQLELEFRIKNIFDPKDINLSIDLIQSLNNDFYWEGITQHILHLKPNQQSRFKLKLIFFRSGVFNIAKNIKYIISINKANSYTISHHQYENLYILIKNSGKQEIAQQSPKQSSQFDFFQNFEALSFKKTSKNEQESDSLI